jgi:hypothetical protein
MVTERRHSPRSKPFGLVYLSLASDNGGIVLDASEDGLQFQAVAPVEHDDGPVPMWFTLSHANRIETVGEIVWTDESKKTGGLRFTNLEAPARIQIRKWLEQNGSALPVRAYAGPAARASSESVVIDEPVHGNGAASISKPPAVEIEEAPEAADVEIIAPSTLFSNPAPTVTPPPAPWPAPALAATPAPTIVPHPVELPTPPSTHSAASTPIFVPRSVEPPPTPARLATPAPTIVPSFVEPPPTIRAAAPPASTLLEIVHAAESAPAISQRMSPPAPVEKIEVEPVLLRSHSFELDAPAPAYSGYESEEILREVASAAMHRLDGDPAVQANSHPVVEFPTPIASPVVDETESPYQSRAGISVRTSDYAAPWRPAQASGAALQKRDRVSRIAGFLSRAGVPSDLLRDVEILIVVLALVVSAGIGLLIFHRQVGEGVQWLGQNVSPSKAEAVAKPTARPEAQESAPPDSTLSPLLQRPAATQPSAPIFAKRRPKPVDAASAIPNSALPAATTTADAVATPPLPDDTGEAELATALQYLRGAGGSTEVTNVGVKWLWASVEKGNTKAAIILADLYIWGRGVPQNCDQARVLLTAAAKRASSEAAQRLQDMASDGCGSGAKAPAH